MEIQFITFNNIVSADLLLHIFSMLSGNHAPCLARVCKQWNRVMNETRSVNIVAWLWKLWFEKRFPFSEAKPRSAERWKNLYKLKVLDIKLRCKETTTSTHAKKTAYEHQRSSCVDIIKRGPVGQLPCVTLRYCTDEVLGIQFI